MVIYRIGIQLFIAPVFNKPPLWDATSRLFIPIYSAQKYFKTVIFQSKKAKKTLPGDNNYRNLTVTCRLVPGYHGLRHASKWHDICCLESKRKEKTTMRIGSFLWLALCVTLLGWYGWAMVAIGTVLFIAGYFAYSYYTDYRDKKRRGYLQKENQLPKN